MPERDFNTKGSGAPVETVGNEELIASDRVAGTAVFGVDNNRIGHVHNLMIGKRTGKVAHVIISDAGFFGLGSHRYITVPWDDLDYSRDLGGYVSGLTKDIMEERGRESAEDADMQIW